MPIERGLNFLTPGPDRTSATGAGTGSAHAVTSSSIAAVNAPSASEADSSSRLAYAGNLEGLEPTAWILTSDLWAQDNISLRLHAGPKSANWTIALRAADETISSGVARFAKARTSKSGSSNRTSTLTYFDLPRVRLDFQSGNIMPLHASAAQLGSSPLPYGLQDFYAFMDLLNQPPLIPSGEKEGTKNYVWCFYHSLQFPQVLLKGYFDPQGISWDDSAEDPARVDWTAELTVHEMAPQIWQSAELSSAYAAFLTGTTFF